MPILFTVEERRQRLFKSVFEWIKSGHRYDDHTTDMLLGLLLLSENITKVDTFYMDNHRIVVVFEQIQHLIDKNPDLESEIIIPRAEKRAAEINWRVGTGLWAQWGRSAHDNVIYDKEKKEWI
jgi:hypothetical protein